MKASLMLLAGVLASCATSNALKEVPVPASGPANHPLYSYHEFQYLSCDYKSGVAIEPLPEVVDPLTSSVFNQDSFHLKAASRAWLYALMANNAYHHQGESYLIPDWKLLSRSESPSGLALDKWVHEGVNGKPDEIVIAFEGTRFSSWADWKTNISLIEPQQSKEAYGYMKDIVAKNPGVRVVTTGHSLGGALALNASLRLSGVDFRGFDSSPRGFFKITRSKYKPADRLFIYEKGEILSVLRVPWYNRLRKFPERYWFNFMDFAGASSSVSEHSMYLISRGLLMAAIKYKDAGAGRVFSANFSQKNLQEAFKRDTSATEKAHDIESCQWIFQHYPAQSRAAGH